LSAGVRTRAVAHIRRASHAKRGKRAAVYHDFAELVTFAGRTVDLSLDGALVNKRARAAPADFVFTTDCAAGPAVYLVFEKVRADRLTDGATAYTGSAFACPVVTGNRRVRRREAGMAACPAVSSVRQNVGAGSIAEVFRFARALAGSAHLSTVTHRCVRFCLFVHNAVAVVVVTVADLGGVGMDVAIRIIAVIAAANVGNVLVAILVEQVEEADRARRIASCVRLASVSLPDFGTIDIGCAGGCIHATFLDGAVSTSGTRGGTAVGAN